MWFTCRTDHIVVKIGKAVKSKSKLRYCECWPWTKSIFEDCFKVGYQTVDNKWALWPFPFWKIFKKSWSTLLRVPMLHDADCRFYSLVYSTTTVDLLPSPAQSWFYLGLLLHGIILDLAGPYIFSLFVPDVISLGWQWCSGRDLGSILTTGSFLYSVCTFSLWRSPVSMHTPKTCRHHHLHWVVSADQNLNWNSHMDPTLWESDQI